MGQLRVRPQNCWKYFFGRMMARGAKPKTAEAVRLAGTPGKRPPRAPARDIGQAVDAFAPPKDLPPKVAAIWSRELPRLQTLGMLKVTDLAGFRVFCGAMARYEAAQSVLDELGLTYTSESKHGTLERLRPEVKVVEAAERTIKAYLAEYAMTSQSRLRAASQLANRQLSLPFEAPPPAAPSPTTEPGPIGILNGTRH